VKVHLARQSAAELHRLKLNAKRLGERSLDEALQAALKLLESHPSTRIPAGRAGPLAVDGNEACRATVFIATIVVGIARASGGIGRRAGFRFLCPQGRGGSSPPSPTDCDVAGHPGRISHDIVDKLDLWP